MELEKVKENILKDIEKVKDLKGLDEIYRKYLSQKGEISLVFENLKNLEREKRIKVGKEANELKNFLEDLLTKKKIEIEDRIQREIEEKEWLDITLPVKKIEVGHLHPLTQVKKKVEDIFQAMGFEVVEGPEIETERYNFDALNIPKEHPARDMWDTLWLRSDNVQCLLLRTHTSPVQVRYMEKNQPPLRIIVPGNVYRHEATDVSHEFQLCQAEGLMVGKDISVANFKAVIREFLKNFFGKEIKIRLKPDFFPFTEPSFDVSMNCLVCDGKGCPACKKSGWLEIAGAGMVHPNVFKNSGLNPKDWQGWAFGFGLDRLAMMKFKIGDIRLFRSGDLRFLQQF